MKRLSLIHIFIQSGSISLYTEAAIRQLHGMQSVKSIIMEDMQIFAYTKGMLIFFMSIGGKGKWNSWY